MVTDRQTNGNFINIDKQEMVGLIFDLSGTMSQDYQKINESNTVSVT